MLNRTDTISDTKFVLRYDVWVIDGLAEECPNPIPKWTDLGGHVRRSDAITLYQRRKTDARMGVKMPEVRARRAVLFEEIAADALVYSKEHKASYPGDRSTVGKLLPVFGKVPLDDIAPHNDQSLPGHAG